MSNTFGFVSEDTFSEKMDTLNQFLAAIANGTGGSLKPTSWTDIQTLVRTGLASKVFHPQQDQFICKRGEETLVWDVLGHDIDKPADPDLDHTMTLGLHDCLATTIMFDQSEALYYCENALAAGTYNFTLLAGYDTSYGGGKTYQFTLANTIPAGGVICFPWAWGTQASATKISTYKTRTDTTPIETVSVTEGSGGTSLGTANGNTENMNHTHKMRYGSSAYTESAIRQFLNSDKAVGTFWTPQTKFDRPPSGNNSIAGFMNGLDSDFLSVIGKTKKVVSRNTITDGGGFDTIEDKFFLLSMREIFAGDSVTGVIEGEPYPYYSQFSDYTSANINTDSNRIKYRNGTAQWWWLRTPYPWYGSYPRSAGAAGRLGYYSAHSGGGVSLACNIM